MLKGLPFQFCLNTDAGLPLPDLTLYLTVSPEVAAARAAYGTERYETIQIQTQVRKEFALVADQVRARHGDDRWVEVDASGNIDMVEERIWNSVRPMLVHEIGTVGTLWA